MKKYLALVVAMFALAISGCLEDEGLRRSSADFVPIIMDDGWAVDTASVRTDSLAQIAQTILTDYEFAFVRSVVVAHRGKLVFECYTHSEDDRTSPRHIWSVTKSVVSILAGIALNEGYIHSVADSVFSYLPEYRNCVSSDHLGITIKDCLTMSSGLSYDDDSPVEKEIMSENPPDLLRYLIDRPMAAAHGTATVYKNADAQLMAKAIENVTHTDLVEFAADRLLRHISISNYYWSRYRNSQTYGCFGLWLTPRDMTKLGQLLLNNGAWDGKQIVPREWLAEATRAHTSMSGSGYGYFFWLGDSGGQYCCWGFGGQVILVDPAHELVLSITSDPFNRGGISLMHARLIAGRIVNALK